MDANAPGMLHGMPIIGDGGAGQDGVAGDGLAGTSGVQNAGEAMEEDARIGGGGGGEDTEGGGAVEGDGGGKNFLRVNVLEGVGYIVYCASEWCQRCE
jgi:hypothetical protein